VKIELNGTAQCVSRRGSGGAVLDPIGPLSLWKAGTALMTRRYVRLQSVVAVVVDEAAPAKGRDTVDHHAD
jgi:hypothetical protein